MRQLQLSLPAAAFLGLVVMTAPAVSLPTLPPAATSQAGSFEPVRSYERWRCVKKGRCWVPCRGSVCRRACFPSWWSCRRSLR
jgi:hypothetical protein